MNAAGPPATEGSGGLQTAAGVGTADRAEADSSETVARGLARHSTRSDRVAFWTFVAYLAAALPLLLWIGSYRWFYGDEWSFLTDRSVSLDGLFRPHNQQHWVTLPVLAYRGLFSVFGLRAYWPYQLLVIALHLTTAALLRVVMRRSGVGAWIATVAAGAFVLLGPAEDNILWAFQITFVGALVAGLAQLVLADHDGPIDRRDWIGLGVGLVGLMMSGQAPSLIIGVGLVCLLRRRWKAAVFHTLPLGAIYIVWFAVEHAQTVLRVDGQRFTASDYMQWMKNAATGLFMALGHFAPFAILLAALLVGGTVLAWRSEGAIAFLKRASVPTSLVVVCLISMTTAAPSRFFLGPETARAGRYIGVMAALTLPAIAVAADAVARRWPRSMPLVLLVFLVPVPFNVVAFGDDPVLTRQFYENERVDIASLPASPLARQVPPWVRPNESIVGQPGMTVGWLLEARRNGDLPPAGPPRPNAVLTTPLQLGVARVSGDAAQGLRCEAYDGPINVDPQLGDRWILETPVGLAGRSGDRPSTPWLVFEPSNIEITLPDLRLILSPVAGQDEFRLCR